MFHHFFFIHSVHPMYWIHAIQPSHFHSCVAGGFKHFLFSPLKLGKINPFWRAYFSKGVGSTTNQICLSSSAVSPSTSPVQTTTAVASQMRDQDGLQEATNVPCRGIGEICSDEKNGQNGLFRVYIYYRYYDRDYIGGYSRDYIEDYWGFIYIGDEILASLVYENMS